MPFLLLRCRSGMEIKGGTVFIFRNSLFLILILSREDLVPIVSFFLCYDELDLINE